MLMMMVSVTYYATYTAYDGYAILPKLIETKDFYHFVVKPLHGDYAQNKGLALFPRKINGSYAMLSRIDGVSNYVMFSDDITLWDSASIIQSPKYPWEFVQIGNAGSPIETEYGWLVITHSVGPVRTYSLGAILLDLDDPTRLIARLEEPLLKANEKEREGYVPNAIYSCGVMIHNGEVIIPYAMSDFASSIATISLENLLSEMVTENNTSFKDFLNINKTSILLADDDATIRRLLTKFLSEQGFLVTAVSDGIDALMLLGREKFDLVLSDVGMPNFDGFQLLRLMNEKGIDIPVVFLTGNYTSESLEKSAALGAVEYIKKPVKVDELLKILNRLLVISQ